MPHGITQCYLPPGGSDIPALTRVCGVDIGRPEELARPRGGQQQLGGLLQHAVGAVHNVLCVCARRRVLSAHCGLCCRRPHADGTHHLRSASASLIAVCTLQLLLFVT